MSEIQNHTNFSLAIADDVIIYSKDQSSHLNHISQILELFDKHGLKLGINKCNFFKIVLYLL